MFKQAQLNLLTQVRDNDNNIIKLLARVSIEDDLYGTLFTEYSLEGSVLEEILAKPSDSEIAQEYYKWIEREVSLTYTDWMNRSQVDKSTVLTPKGLEERYGVVPIMTALPTEGDRDMGVSEMVYVSTPSPTGDSVISGTTVEGTSATEGLV